jgi:site-specific DNA recombinase
VIAATYARKSTREEKANDEARSVTRQIELARSFIDRQNWTLPDHLIFSDDGVSGGIFDPKQRPGLAAMMAAARSGEFSALVVMNQSRLARRQRYAVDIVHDLHDAGVRIFCYQTGLEVKLDTATERFLVGVTGFTDEQYRESIQVTTREVMRRKAERGEVVGNLVYGYRNLCMACGKPTTPRTCACQASIRREIDPAQAEGVRRIFTLIAEGNGLQKTAKRLNAEGLPGPRGPWSASTIRSLVFNELFRGLQIYGRSRWEDRGEKKVKVAVPANQWVRKALPELRIVSEDLWTAAHDRLSRTREAYLRMNNGRVWGRPESGRATPDLLTGQSVCGVCGGSLFVRKRPNKKYPDRPAYQYYACSIHHLRGVTACANAMTMPRAAADAAVLNALKKDILNPEALTLAVEETLSRYNTRPQSLAAQQTALTAELRKLATEIDTLYGHLASGLAGIPDQIKARERRQREAQAELDRVTGLASLPRLDKAGLSKELRARLTEWATLLDAEPVRAKQILRKLAPERIVFTPDGKGYRFEGRAAYGRFLAGVVLQNRTNSGPPLYTKPTIEDSDRLPRSSRLAKLATDDQPDQGDAGHERRQADERAHLGKSHRSPADLVPDLEQVQDEEIGAGGP